MKVARLTWLRLKLDLVVFVRRRDELFFTFLLPVLLLVLFGSVFPGDVDEVTGVSFPQYFFAGIVGSVALSVGFGTLCSHLAADRASGTMRRLASTPMSPLAYVLGKVAFVVVVAVAQVVILLVLGVVAFGLDVPKTAGHWFTLAWVLIVGLIACGAAGVAYSRFIRDVRSISAMISPVVAMLPFLSGVYFSFHIIPPWMQSIGSAFPLRWITLGMRSAMLPDVFATVEPGGGWQHGRIAVMLGLWTVAMLVVGVRGFRWARIEK